MQRYSQQIAAAEAIMTIWPLLRLAMPGSTALRACTVPM